MLTWFACSLVCLFVCLFHFCLFVHIACAPVLPVGQSVGFVGWPVGARVDRFVCWSVVPVPLERARFVHAAQLFWFDICSKKENYIA